MLKDILLYNSTVNMATHDGGMHADDILATSLIRVIRPDAKLTRSRDPAVLAMQDVVFDVGGEYNYLGMHLSQVVDFSKNQH